jgi:transposase
MQGQDQKTGELLSYVDLEKRVPAEHPMRLVRSVVNEALAAPDRDFSRAHADGGRPSITPERLPRALLLQPFDTIRSEPLVRWSRRGRAGVGSNGVHEEPRSAA